LDKDWPGLAEIINGECHPDDPRQESAYRKPYQSALLYYNNVFSKMNSGDDYSKQLQVQKDELYILKKQYYDQRREYNKLLDVDARWRHLEDIMIESAKQVALQKPLLISKSNVRTGKKEAILCINDWHYGLVTNNIFNTYSIAICRERVATLVAKCIEYLQLHEITVLHILLLADAAHGAIHVGTRVASEEDTCDQLMHVSELFAEVISALADSVDYIKVYSTYGNHLRTIQDKHDSIHSDNMEKIIPWWLKQRLSHRDDVEIIDSEYYEFIRLNVLGHPICATHGDLDSFKNVGVTMNSIFTQVYNETIRYAIMADKHHLEENEPFGIESILCRSLCGSEEYANGHRLYSKPGQTLLIFSESEGRECTYNIKVS
jgi:hypothetical protein